MNKRRKNKRDRRWANNGGSMGTVGQERQNEWLYNDNNTDKRNYTDGHNGRRANR